MTRFPALLMFAAAAFVPQDAPTSPPPAPPPVGDYTPPDRALLTWRPGDVRCEGGVAVSGNPLRKPLSDLAWSVDTGQRPMTYRFAIDASGRPLSIERVGQRERRFGEDIGPALAASQFSTPHAVRGCSITFYPILQPVASASIEELVSYTMNPLSGTLPKEGWDRIALMGNCADLPRPQPLVRVFPDFRKLPATPGVKDWALVAYDTDRNGKPVNVRSMLGTGNGPLAAASVKAMRKSRFTGGARTGCVYPFWRMAATLPAPPMPEEEAFRRPNATCAGERKWATPPTLRFPEPYRRRRIEGWAIVSYDVASWGEIGNVRTLQSEPTGDFGEQAMDVMRSATVAPSEQGMTGCVDRVKFVMGPDTMPPADNEPPRPVY